MSGEQRQRVDLWLWRARFVKTRAAGSRLVAEGGVRLVRDGAGRRLDKPSATLAVGDTLIVPLPGGGLRGVRVAALGLRRGPAAEARGLFVELAPGEAGSLDGPGEGGHVSDRDQPKAGE